MSVRKIKAKIIHHFPIVGKVRFKLKRYKSFTDKIKYRMKYQMDDPQYAQYVDKLLLKEYAKNKGVESPRTLALLDQFEIDQIPENCVIKMNNGYARNIIIKDGIILAGPGKGETLRSQEALILETIEAWKKPFSPNREPHYQYIQPQLFLEELMYPIPEDYKFFVFHGKVRIIQTDLDRFGSHCRMYYDRDWNNTSCMDKLHHPCADEFPKPENLELLIEVAEKLAPPIDFVRVDLYSIESRILAGELTFTPGAGNEDIKPEACDKMFSSWW